MKTQTEIKSFIRDEMNKLDKITGISTANSPIFITNSYNLAGTYTSKTTPDCFSFSKRFFLDVSIDKGILQYIVRHEYAHCLCFRIYGERGHGWRFKQCSKKLNCYPDKAIHEFLRERTQLYLLTDIRNSQFHSSEFHQ